MRKKILFGLVSGIAATSLALLLRSCETMDRIESATWAGRVQTHLAPGAATDNVRVILLDQPSLDWGKQEFLWPWPWPREVYSAITAYCRRGGARAIIFDVLFTEPSIHGVADDEGLGTAFREQPDAVGAVWLNRDSKGEAVQWPEHMTSRPPAIGDMQAWLQDSDRATNATANSATFPIPEIATNVLMLGDVRGDPDADGVCKRISLFKVFDGSPVPTLGCAAYLAGQQRLGRSTEMRIADDVLHVGDATVPIDESGRAILRFRGPSQTHRTFSAMAVIQSEMCLREGLEPPIRDPSVFKDCYVLFGFSAPGLMDLRPTPISKVYPGVEIHATVLDNLLSGDFMREAPTLPVIAWTLLTAIAAALAIVFSRRAWHGILALTVFLPIPWITGSVAYDVGVWWPIAIPTTAVLLAVMAGAIVNYATEGRQRLFLKRAFRFYLNPAVVDRIIRDPSQLQLGGERRELTILFSDLQGFSTISEKMDPESLTALLNDFLSEMTDIVLATGGTLDKYEGDAIIAFWNAPLGQPDHTLRACGAVIRCQRRLEELADDFKARCGSDLVMRVGLNTGEVVVGNMGSKLRFNYTVLGDAANLASRLEGANKAFGTRVMVSESTWEKTGGQFTGRELGRIRVVGRSTPVRVYELADEAGTPAPDAWKSFAEGLARCYEGDTEAALKIFESQPDDPPSQRYAARCREVIHEGTTWDGIWNLTQK